MPGEVSTRPNFVASASGSEKAALKKPSTKLNKDPSGAKGERSTSYAVVVSLRVSILGYGRFDAIMCSSVYEKKLT